MLCSNKSLLRRYSMQISMAHIDISLLFCFFCFLFSHNFRTKLNTDSTIQTTAMWPFLFVANNCVSIDSSMNLFIVSIFAQFKTNKHWFVKLKKKLKKVKIKSNQNKLWSVSFIWRMSNYTHTHICTPTFRDWHLFCFICIIRTWHLSWSTIQMLWVWHFKLKKHLQGKFQRADFSREFIAILVFIFHSINWFKMSKKKTKEND